MGSIVRFARPRPAIRHPRAKVEAERESREAQRSLLILIVSFLITAIVMCAVVVAMVSSTWTDVLIMSAFVLVFALLKIVLADALIYTMLRYDAATANAPAETGSTGRYRRFAPIRQPPARGRQTGPLRTSELRMAKTRRTPS
jgi:membrane protein YdbS with pleckstrin-like domain